MMNAMDQTDTPAVIVRCLDSDTVVRLYNRWRPDKDSIHYAVEACAPGLSARIDEAVAAGLEVQSEALGHLPPPDRSVLAGHLRALLSALE